MAKKSYRPKERFVGIPHRVVNSDPYIKNLRAPEVKLLQDILIQYNGKNNGMLSACHTLMEKRGWAKASLHRALSNLLHHGFLVITRQGWKQRGKPTLLAITWEGINDPYINSKVIYDSGIIPSHSPLHYWCKAADAWKNKPGVRRKKPEKQKKVSTPNRSRSAELVPQCGELKMNLH